MLTFFAGPLTRQTRAPASDRGAAAPRKVTNMPTNPPPSAQANPTRTRSPQHQFERAADFCGLPPEIREILSQPKNELIVNFPVRMDDGRVPAVQGLPRPAQQHPRPLQGRHPLPRGGHPRRGQGAGGLDDLQVRAARHPVRRRQGRHQVQAPRATRRRARAHHPPLHPRARQQHRPRLRHPRARRGHQRPDHGLDDGHVHERRRTPRQEREPAASSPARPCPRAARTAARPATGQGIVHCITEWARDRRFDLNGATYTVQGFGNVGSNAAKILARTGASLIAVGDWKGYIANAEGINPFKLAEYVQPHRLGGRLSRHAVHHARRVLRDRGRHLRPRRARAGDRRGRGARRCTCKVIVEGANGPTDPRAEPILAEKGIDLIPDILANSGGVVRQLLRVAAEQALRDAGTWKRSRRSLAKRMKRTYLAVSEYAATRKCDWRTAAMSHRLWTASPSPTASAASSPDPDPDADQAKTRAPAKKLARGPARTKVRK